MQLHIAKATIIMIYEFKVDMLITIIISTLKKYIIFYFCIPLCQLPQSPGL